MTKKNAYIFMLVIHFDLERTKTLFECRVSYTFCINNIITDFHKQDVREAYAYFFSQQECDLVTVLVGINLLYY